MANHHFFPEFLLKSWRQKKNGKVLCFDSGAERFSEMGTGRLFSVPDLNHVDDETRLNRLIETPVSRHVAALQTAPAERESGRVPIDDWALFRAFVLLVFGQGARTQSAVFGRPLGGESLGWLLRQSEADLDAAVQEVRGEFNLVRYCFPEEHQLFVPPTGTFGFPAHDTTCITGHTFAAGLPLTPRMALALVPVTASEAILRAPWIASVSAGTSDRVGHVVVPPDYAAAFGRDYVKAGILAQQENARKLVDSVQRARAITVRMYETAGFKVGPAPD